MKNKQKLALLGVILMVLIVAFIFIGLNSKNWEFALSLRLPKVVAIALTGGVIAFSSTIFQTITNNNILTPSVLGLDSLYILVQTFLVFVFGSSTLMGLGGEFNFILSVGIMSLFSL